MPRDSQLKLLVAGCFLAACSLEYQSGITQCSDQQTCPEGYSCSAGRCFFGGSGGTGGSRTSNPDMGGGSQPGQTSSMPNPVSCDDPDYPILCPARAGAAAVCTVDGRDCGTLQKCPDGRTVICRPGETVNCQYVNSCTAQSCTQSDSKMCPARGQVGPGCFSSEADCSTVTLCSESGRIFACQRGFAADCNPATGGPRCAPGSASACATGDFFCPGNSKSGASCWGAQVDCTTGVACGEEDVRVCYAGFVVDCSVPKEGSWCVPKAGGDGGVADASADTRG